jgi:predicted RNase H-like nuclease (RuvC/YqgF family)
MVDTSVINEVVKQVEKYRSRLIQLEEEKKKLEVELPLVKTNLDALERTLAIIQGKEVESKEQIGVSLKPSSSSTEDLRYLLRKDSLTDLAYSLLKEDGNPLSPSELFERIKAKKPDVKKYSLMSGIYRLINLKRVFKKSQGKIGLLEWGK